jgi:hypothetical protein
MQKVLDIGDDIQFGEYYHKPILWKCMWKDKNEMLMVSEHIICMKAFDAAELDMKGINDCGSNKWANSNLREWLNSNDQKIKYTTHPPTKKAIYGYSDGYNAYESEPGFLTGFTEEEISSINTVEHDQVKDIIFLLSREEVEKFWKNREERIKTITETARSCSEYKIVGDRWWYWTRTPWTSTSSELSWPRFSNFNYDVTGVSIGGILSFCVASKGNGGVLPALYLKADIIL